jgi:hypothetical protein
MVTKLLIYIAVKNVIVYFIKRRRNNGKGVL